MPKYRILLNVVLVVILALLVIAPGVASAAAPASATASTVNAPSGCWYHVRHGNTLANVAYRYHTSVWTLARMNDIWNINKIYAGQWLKVPCAPKCTWHCW
jgi:LysM repeat protein